MLRKSIAGLLFLSLITFGSIASAQDAPGPAGAGPAPMAPQFRGFVEASLGVNMCSGDTCDNDLGSLDPGLGINLAAFWLITPQIAAGVTFGYHMLTPNVDGLDDTSFGTTQFGLEGRFFLPTSPNIKVYGLLGLGMGTGEFDFNGYTLEEDLTYVRLGGGVDFMVGPNLAIGGMLYYQVNSWDSEDGEDDDFDFIYIGAKLSVYF